MGENEKGERGRERDDAEAGEKTQARVPLSPTVIQCVLVSKQIRLCGGKSFNPRLHIIIVKAAGCGLLNGHMRTRRCRVVEF